jgi:hypothetical protein
MKLEYEELVEMMSLLMGKNKVLREKKFSHGHFAYQMDLLGLKYLTFREAILFS